jgi:2-iminobutanoate/2-iminopropanoate deaminase
MVHRLAFLVCAAALVSTGCASTRIIETSGASRTVIATDNAPAAIAAYSQGIEVGNTLYLAGQIGTAPKTRELVPGGIGAEVRQALTNCQAVLEAAGYTLEDVAQVQVLLADINDYAALNEVYVTFFPKDPPARAAYAVAALPRGARVEILMTAAK